MRCESIAGGDAGVQEVLSRIVGHVETLHQAARASVDGSGVGDELAQAELVEREDDRGARRLTGDAPTPVATSQTPAELDRGRERDVDLDRVEPDVAREWRLTWDLHRPQAVSAVLEGALEALDRCFAARAGERRRVVLHHLLIGVERREVIDVGCSPAAQEQALGPQLPLGVHVGIVGATRRLGSERGPSGPRPIRPRAGRGAA
jgi:hypothetical protein